MSKRVILKIQNGPGLQSFNKQHVRFIGYGSPVFCRKLSYLSRLPPLPPKARAQEIPARIFTAGWAERETRRHLLGGGGIVAGNDAA